MTTIDSIRPDSHNNVISEAGLELTHEELMRWDSALHEARDYPEDADDFDDVEDLEDFEKSALDNAA